MDNDKFIATHAKNDQREINSYISHYESMLTNPSTHNHNSTHNYLKNLLMGSNSLVTIVRLLQAKKAGVLGMNAWNFRMSWDMESVYKTLKSI